MKKASGFYLTVLTLVLCAAAAIAYAVNCGTAYYSKYGMDMVTMLCLAGGAVAALLAIALDKVPVIGSVMTIAAPVAAIVGVMNLLNVRVESIALIYTMENNASNLSDVMSCIIALVVGLLAMIFGIIAAFKNKTVKA